MAGVVSGFVQDVAWLMKNAALRKDVPRIQWATVTSASPVMLLMDGDMTATPRGVTGNAAGNLSAGQRVRVDVQGTRITVLAASPLDSGWQNISLSSGFSGTAQVRRTESWVEMRCVVNGSFPLGNTVFGSIGDPALHPLVVNARLAAYMNGAISGTAYVATDGSVGITHQASTRTNVQARGVWRND